MSQKTKARMEPGLIQVNLCFAAGAEEVIRATVKRTTQATIGHCTMLHTTWKTLSSPIASARPPPMEPPKITMPKAVTMRMTTARDIKIERPYTFQKGLSSSTSYMTFIASMIERKAPETPHKASAMEMIAPNVKALSAWLSVMERSWVSMNRVADSGI